MDEFVEIAHVRKSEMLAANLRLKLKAVFVDTLHVHQVRQLG